MKKYAQQYRRVLYAVALVFAVSSFTALPVHAEETSPTPEQTQRALDFIADTLNDIGAWIQGQMSGAQTGGTVLGATSVPNAGNLSWPLDTTKTIAYESKLFYNPCPGCGSKGTPGVDQRSPISIGYLRSGYFIVGTAMSEKIDLLSPIEGGFWVYNDHGDLVDEQDVGLDMAGGTRIRIMGDYHEPLPRNPVLDIVDDTSFVYGGGSLATKPPLLGYKVSGGSIQFLGKSDGVVTEAENDDDNIVSHAYAGGRVFAGLLDTADHPKVTATYSFPSLSKSSAGSNFLPEIGIGEWVIGQDTSGSPRKIVAYRISGSSMTDRKVLFSSPSGLPQFKHDITDKNTAGIKVGDVVHVFKASGENLTEIYQWQFKPDATGNPRSGDKFYPTFALAGDYYVQAVCEIEHAKWTGYTGTQAFRNGTPKDVRACHVGVWNKNKYMKSVCIPNQVTSGIRHDGKCQETFPTGISVSKTGTVLLTSENGTFRYRIPSFSPGATGTTPPTTPPGTQESNPSWNLLNISSINTTPPSNMSNTELINFYTQLINTLKALLNSR